MVGKNVYKEFGISKVGSISWRDKVVSRDLALLGSCPLRVAACRSLV
jgi:hypothetical protein